MSITKSFFIKTLLLLITGVVAVALQSTLATATSTYYQLSHSVYPRDLQINSDGTKSYFRCGHSGYYYPRGEFYYGRQLSTNHSSAYIPTYNPSSNYMPERPYVGNCSIYGSTWGDNYFMRDDGALVGKFEFGSHPNSLYTALALYKDGEFKWQNDMSMQCNNGRTRTTGVNYLKEGYDGNIYGIVQNPCENTDYRFVGINPSDGSTHFSITMSTTRPTNISLGAGHFIGVHTNGVILLDGSDLRFFDYSGTEDTDKRKSITTNPAVHATRLTVSPNGHAYVYLKGSSEPNPCSPNGNNYEEVYSYRPDTSDDILQINTCSSYISDMMTHPNGGLIVSLARANEQYKVIHYDHDGNIEYEATIPQEQGWSTTSSAEFPLFIDQFGNIIKIRNLTENGGDEDRHIKVYRITPEGSVSTIFTTQDYAIAGIRQQYFAASTLGVGFSTDKVHLAVCHEQCADSNPAYIHEVTVEGIGVEYPRNFIGSAIEDYDIDNDGDGLTKWQEIQQGTSDDNVDSDGDGLDDFLESRWNPDRHDLFCNNDRSVCEYPNPSEKDIYVEVDWMTRPAENGVDSYTTKPSGDQIDEIKEAFADKGIHAHFDTGQLGGGNEVPYNHVVKFGVIPNEIDFYDYKKGGDGISANFNPDRYQIYHYMLSGYRFNEPPAPASSGVALVSDDDFFVSFGALKEDFGFVWPGNSEKAITGTIIHELGHNLCLTSNTHNDPACSFEGIDANYGNSYPSAMNYDRQFELIDYSTGENGSGDHDDWGALRLNDFASSNIGDEAHDLLHSMQQQTMRMRSPLHLQPQYREFQNKLREFERSVERHE